jgi:DNA polymerase III delta subunit
MTLADILQSPIPDVATAAARVQNAQLDCASGTITATEYTDLCADALSLDRITADMTDLVLRQRITEAFDALKEIAASGMAPL